jgi:REP element-mobilizing transposase RayT
MSQSLAKIYVHIAFSTVRKEMHAYQASILKAYDSPPLIVNGVSDHVHVLCDLSRKFTPAEVIKELKRGSSKWIKTKGDAYSNFYWQGGYGAFSVSQSNVEKVRNYIAGQEKHHRHF